MKNEALKLALDYIVATNKSSQFWLVPESNLNKTVTAIKQALEAPVQEPVAWISKHGVVYPFDAKDEVHPINELQPLYSTPPAQREWRWLTDEEIYEAFDTIIEEPKQATQFCYNIQKKLKEKNT